VCSSDLGRNRPKKNVRNVADIWWKKGINWSVQMNSVDMSEI